MNSATHKGITQRESKLLGVRERCYMPLFTCQPNDQPAPNLKLLPPSGVNRQRNIKLCLLCAVLLCGARAGAGFRASNCGDFAPKWRFGKVSGARNWWRFATQKVAILEAWGAPLNCGDFGQKSGDFQKSILEKLLFQFN